MEEIQFAKMLMVVIPTVVFMISFFGAIWFAGYTIDKDNKKRMEDYIKRNSHRDYGNEPTATSLRLHHAFTV